MPHKVEDMGLPAIAAPTLPSKGLLLSPGTMASRAQMKGCCPSCLPVQHDGSRPLRRWDET
eukprot:15434621-Alexandrium_andersonii.AAC.1